MEKSRTLRRIGWGRGRCLVSVAFALILGLAGLSEAATLYDGEKVDVKLDTTLTYGLTWRVEDRDQDLIGVGNGGSGANPNWDDGNLNYDKGLVANQIRFTSEMDIKAENVGAFVRGTGFYDFENVDGDRDRTDLGDKAEEQVGKDIDLLDAYVWGSFDVGPFPMQLRLGEQVVNWGESTFILGGIGLNTLNPVNVSKLRSPGAELREALVPEGMAYVSIGVSEDLSLEGLYQYDWEETALDEPGTYFSILDFGGEDGQKVIAANIGDNLDASAGDTFLAIPRASDKDADDQGQFGVTLRYYAQWLNDTELSFYFMNYHSKTATLALRTGTAQGAADGAAAAAAVYANAGVGPGADPSVDAMAQAAATDAYLKTARYRANYAEDINLFGLGFNTELFGWGLQGEVSHRQDVPLQIDDTELLFALLSSIDTTGALGANNQVGDFTGQFETWIPEAVEKDITQVQVTASKLFGPLLGSSGSAFVAEVAWHHVHDMPSKDELRLETFGPYGTGNTILGPATGTRVEGTSDFPDADSWGYALLFKLDYENVIGPIGLSPKGGWSHDVTGISPNGGPFIEGRRAVTLGLEGRYLANWTADLSYTSYSGGGKLNLLNDRDFIGFNIKYRF